MDNLVHHCVDFHAYHERIHVGHDDGLLDALRREFFVLRFKNLEQLLDRLELDEGYQVAHQLQLRLHEQVVRLKRIQECRHDLSLVFDQKMVVIFEDFDRVEKVFSQHCFVKTGNDDICQFTEVVLFLFLLDDVE